MCVISGKVDYIVQAMDDEIKKIVCMITELDDLAYATYKPIVEEICARKASESEVEYLLDYMVGICSSDRMLELFKCVCRKYIYLYPEMVTSEIYTYKSSMCKKCTYWYDDKNVTAASSSSFIF